MTPLFEARSVAVIGASPSNPYTRNVIPRILASDGMRVHLVNPNRESVDGRPCFPDVRDIPEQLDLAFVAVPAPAVLDVLRAAHGTGVGAAIVVSAGFAESAGGDGQDLSGELTRFARETGMVICGPSCLGLANNLNDRDLFATGLPGKIPQGHIALVSQSGGTVSGMVKSAIVRNLGFSHVVSSGGELCTNTCDYFEYLLQSPATRVICFFLEQLVDPERFLVLCREAAAQDIALFCIKIGRSEPGRRAALGHTGSITGQDAYFEALFEEGGVTRCSSVEEMLDAAALLAQSPRQFRPRGKRIGIVTVSGGTGTLLADLASVNGLDVPPLGERTRTAIEALLPARVRVSNPIDIAAQLRGAERQVWNQALREAARGNEFDTLLVAELHPYAVRDIEALADIRRETDMPILLASTTDGVSILDQDAIAEAGRRHVPIASGADAAVKALAGAVRHSTAIGRVAARPARWWALETATTLTAEAADAGSNTPVEDRDEVEWRRIFGGCGVASAREVLIPCGADAITALEGMHPPFAVKGLVPGVLHKAELGLVSLRIPSIAEAARKVVELTGHAVAQKLALIGCIVQEMVRDPVCELYISSLAEDGGRPIVTLGLGGGNVEGRKQFIRKLAPIDLTDARAMIGHLLDGGYDRPLFEEAAASIARLSEIAVAYRDEVQLFEINPLMVSSDGSARIVDTVVVTNAPD